MCVRVDFHCDPHATTMCFSKAASELSWFWQYSIMPSARESYILAYVMAVRSVILIM